MLLYYLPGSPFARMARVLLREFEIPCTEKEIKFPPPPEYFEVNPLGQVPVLDDGKHRYFPTRIVLERILAEALANARARSEFTLPPKLFREGSRLLDEQLLTILLTMGDVFSASKYQQWAGLGLVGPNALGFDPAKRNMERVFRTLDWLERSATPTGFWPHQLSTQDVVLACILLWSDARGPIEWRGRPNLEAIVSRLQHRPSFTATAPGPWQPNRAGPTSVSLQA